MRQAYTYFLQNFQCTTILIPAFCKISDHETVLQECKSKQKQLHVHNSYKTREKSNKLSYWFEKVEENMDLSHIYLELIIQFIIGNPFLTFKFIEQVKRYWNDLLYTKIFGRNWNSRTRKLLLMEWLQERRATIILTNWIEQ